MVARLGSAAVSTCARTHRGKVRAPEDGDALTETSCTAKATAAASQAALQAVTPTVDCGSTSVAQDVATFKAAAEQARTDLKTYKTAVKALVTALQAARTTTEGN